MRLKKRNKKDNHSLSCYGFANGTRSCGKTFMTNQIAQNVHAELCPVCKGSGKYKKYFTTFSTGAIYTEMTCHGCGGKGWVVVQITYGVR